MCKNNIKAQATLELSLAIICVLLLLVGVLNVFIWANKLLLTRNSEYRKTRLSASQTYTEAAAQVDESKFPPLKILGE
jgi:uncharacterized protein (UPF0333 family)